MFKVATVAAAATTAATTSNTAGFENAGCELPLKVSSLWGDTKLKPDQDKVELKHGRKQLRCQNWPRYLQDKNTRARTTPMNFSERVSKQVKQQQHEKKQQQQQ